MQWGAKQITYTGWRKVALQQGQHMHPRHRTQFEQLYVCTHGMCDACVQGDYVYTHHTNLTTTHTINQAVPVGLKCMCSACRKPAWLIMLACFTPHTQ